MSVRLAIDTSIGTTVALQLGEDRFVTGSADERGHAEVIGVLLAEVFQRATDHAARSVTPALVEAVVVGVGPGPFTGLRVGIAAAQAFAAGRGVPLLPVSGHEAAAIEGLPDRAGDSPVRVLQDARRRELFVTEYSGLDGDGLPVLASAPHLLARAAYVEEPGDMWPSSITGESLLRIAELRLRAGREFGAAEALYLRNPDVYPSARPKRVIP